MTPRQTLIQQLIDTHGYKNYLEIGVLRGDVFFNIRAGRKWAVDPDFQFSKRKRFKKIFRNFSNINARYFEMPSDDFFAQQKSMLTKHRVDVALVDGMHEFAYSLRDVLNTAEYLKPGGVIIMHDCNPVTPEAAVSFKDWEKRGFTGEWNGDVWKTVLYLQCLRKDLHVFTADTDHGLGIITLRPGEPNNLPFKSFEEIDRLSYTELAQHRAEWLNLKPAAVLDAFIKNPYQ